MTDATSPAASTAPQTSPRLEGMAETWRVGQHYGLHVYAGDRPVATFHRADEALAAVEARNAALSRSPAVAHGPLWRPMSEEPYDRPITARMRLADGSWWYARVKAYRYEDGEGGRFGDHGYALLHYNGDVTMGRFYGPFDGWCEIGADVPAVAQGVPAGVVRLVPEECSAEMMRAFWAAGPYPAKPFRDGYRALLAAAPQPTVCKLVPVIPTEAMYQAGDEKAWDGETALGIWQAMLAAVPVEPVSDCLSSPGSHLEPRIRFRIDAAVERGADDITINLRLARLICAALAPDAKAGAVGHRIVTVPELLTALNAKGCSYVATIKDVQDVDWEIRHERLAASGAAPAGGLPGVEALPEDAYYVLQHDCFYRISDGRGLGIPFWEKWRGRSKEFPQSRKKGRARLAAAGTGDAGRGVPKRGGDHPGTDLVTPEMLDAAMDEAGSGFGAHIRTREDRRWMMGQAIAAALYTAAPTPPATPATAPAQAPAAGGDLREALAAIRDEARLMVASIAETDELDPVKLSNGFEALASGAERALAAPSADRGGATDDAQRETGMKKRLNDLLDEYGIAFLDKQDCPPANLAEYSKLVIRRRDARRKINDLAFSFRPDQLAAPADGTAVPAELGAMLARATEVYAVETPSRAIIDVLAERRRQMNVERWTPGHDDGHSEGELAQAAACYASRALYGIASSNDDPPDAWPWMNGWWKPTFPRAMLVKAGALILAEIERLDRATPEVPR